MKKLRCAVVGVGYLGRFHAQKYAQLSEAELVGVCDANWERAQEVASELGVKAFKTPQELVGHIEAVTVASTTTAHYELVKFFLQSGIHVNVEKPITEKYEQAQELLKLAHSKKLNLSVGHIERFNPVFVQLKSQVKKPLLIECTRHAPFRLRGADVSVAHDLMIHDIDLALTLAQSPVKAVFAQGTRVAGGSWDAINATLVFESGALAQISASRVAKEMKREIQVIEEGVIFRGDFMSGQVERSSQGSSDEELVLHEAVPVEKADALYLETQNFVTSVLTTCSPQVSGEAGARALEVVEKVINAL